MQNRMKLRFLDPRRTPMKSRGGWAVPPNFGPGKDIKLQTLKEQFENIGLIHNEHYRVNTNGHNFKEDQQYVVRIMFDDSEYFTIAKIAYG